MEVVHRLRGDKLDLILHISGGSVEGAEAFVSLISPVTDGYFTELVQLIKEIVCVRP